MRLEGGPGLLPSPCRPARRRPAAGGGGIGLRAPHVDGGHRRPGRRCLARGSRGELHGRRARRRARSRRSGGTTRSRCTASGSRSGAPAALDERHLAPAPGARRAARAVPRLRASVLEHRRRRLPEPSAAAALHRGGARHRRGATSTRCRTRSGGRSSSRIRRAICAFATRTIPEPEFLARAGAADRLRPALRRQQRLRERPQSRASIPPPTSTRCPRTPWARSTSPATRSTMRTGTPILIDDHGSPRRGAGLGALPHALARFGPVPTLVEWDTDIPGARRAPRRGRGGRSPDAPCRAPPTARRDGGRDARAA